MSLSVLVGQWGRIEEEDENYRWFRFQGGDPIRRPLTWTFRRDLWAFSDGLTPYYVREILVFGRNLLLERFCQSLPSRLSYDRPHKHVRVSGRIMTYRGREPLLHLFLSPTRTQTHRVPSVPDRASSEGRGPVPHEYSVSRFYTRRTRVLFNISGQIYVGYKERWWI